MTKRQASRITGLDMDEIIGDAEDLRCIVDDGRPVFFKPGKDVFASLVSAVYAFRCQVVLERQRWMCATCGRRTGLSVHHKVHRSKGRSDALSNLEGLCIDCHNAAHGTKKGA